MPGPGRQPRGMKLQVKNPGELFLRLMKYVLKDYKFHCISVVVLIIVSVLCNCAGNDVHEEPDRRIYYTIFIIG